jgi:hypothetical protein
VVAAVFGRQQIAGPRIMPAVSKRTSHNSRELAGYEDTHLSLP